MRMFEYEGKELLRRFGIVTPEGHTADSVDEAVAAGQKTGYPVAVKAQVLTGGRGKAGGVKLAADEQELRRYAEAILGLTIKGETCCRLLLEPCAAIEREFYAGVTLDPSAGLPVLIFSECGGVDIEEVARTQPEKVLTMHLSPLVTLRLCHMLDLLEGSNLQGDIKLKTAKVLLALAEAYAAFDATTLEINPLIVTKSGDLVALDAKAVIDGAAIKRQKLPRQGESVEGELEQRAKGIGVNYVRLDGDVAVIAGGAGLAMATMDLVHHFGKKAGSFLDTGGGISAERTAEALRLSLATPGIRGAVINIFGGINNCEEVAKGVCALLDADKPAAPIVVKMRGHSQDEGWALLEARKVPLVKFGTTEDAVRKLFSVMEGA